MDVSPEELNQLRDILDKLKFDSPNLLKKARGGGLRGSGQELSYNQIVEGIRNNRNMRKGALESLQEEIAQTPLKGSDRLKNFMPGKPPRRKG